MVKKIPLTQGKNAYVDDWRYDELNKHRWFSVNKRSLWYVRRDISSDGKRKYVYMHHQVTGFKYKMVDHIDHDGLNNQECNLRPCTHSQNRKNHRIYKNNTSGLTGVYWKKDIETWMACIKKDGKQRHIGYFSSKEDAGKAYDKKALQLFGKFTVLNFPDG